MNINNIEKNYFKLQKEKILDLGRELFNKGEITKQQLIDTYYYNFISKKNNLITN